MVVLTIGHVSYPTTLGGQITAGVRLLDSRAQMQKAEAGRSGKGEWWDMRNPGPKRRASWNGI